MNLTQILQLGTVALVIVALAVYALWQDRREYAQYLKEQEELRKSALLFDPRGETIYDRVERVDRLVASR